MGNLTSCIKKAGKHLHAKDKAAILASARTYRGDGMDTQAAAIKAAQDQLAAIGAEMDALNAAIKAGAAEADTQEDGQDSQGENSPAAPADTAPAATETVAPANLQEGIAAAQAKAARFAIGKSLTKEQRKQVLESMIDAYKAKGAEREFKGQDSNGNDRYGYAHSPELFEKSDITGAMVRYYVTLPDGRIAHPTELFPNYSQSDIDVELARQQDADQRVADNVARNTAKPLQFETPNAAEQYWDKKSAESANMSAHGERTIYGPLERTLLKNGQKLVMVPDESYAKHAKAYEDAGWKRVSYAEASQQAAPKTEAVAPVWHTKLPEAGTPSKAKNGKPDDSRDVIARIAQEAADAITRTQEMNGGKLYAYVLPSTATEHGALRLLPEDQKPPAPWQMAASDGLSAGFMTKEQLTAKLREMLQSQPVLASGDNKAGPKEQDDRKAKEPAPVNSSLNKPHAIDKKRVLTPAGAIGAGARNSDADSSIWYHQGDIKMLSFTASVTFEGQPAKGAESAKRIVTAVSAAQKAGWSLRSYRAGSLGTVWTLEKDDQFMTKAGLENIGAAQIADPAIPNYGAGYDNMLRGQKEFATALRNWLSTLPPEQRANQAVVSRKMADVLGGWAYVEKDKLGLYVRYRPSQEPGKQRAAPWAHTIPAAKDWDGVLAEIERLAGGELADAQVSSAPSEAAPASKTPASKIDSPTQGVLANAKARKDAAFARLKAMRAGVKNGTANRLDLLKAESAHKEEVQAVDAAQQQLERDANRMGMTTRRDQQGAANPDIRFSFSGARAATADTMALTTAQNRLDAGEDAEAVRQETGWHKGVDGKWRFEISDNEAKVDMALLANLHRGGFDARPIEHVSYRKDDDGTYRLRLAPKNPQAVSDLVSVSGIPANLLPSLLPQSALDAIERNQGDEDFIGANLDDARTVRAPFEFAGFNALPLEVVMDHPKLFAAYPALRDIMVRVDRKLGNGATFAVTDYVGGTVSKVIKIGNPLAKDVDSVLLHEIQHGIQNIEGFATGGSIESARAMQAEAQSSAFSKAQGAWYESRTRWPSAYKALMDQRMLDGRLHDKYGIKTTDEDGHPRRAIVLAVELRQKISEADKDIRSQAQMVYSDAVEADLGGFGSDAFNEFNGLYGAVTKALEGASETPTSVYKRLAGEVEARNTQARKTLTDAQRRVAAPSQTADVADADVIVVFNGKEMASAPAPANAPASAAQDTAQTAPPLRTPISAIRAALSGAYGKLAGQLEAKGLVTLTQTEEQAIEAAAQARADKTGGDVAQIKQSLMAAVKNSLSPMKSIDANIRRGLDSLAKALDERTTVHRAMFRNGLGWVDFVWGDTGTVKPSGKTKGAMGLSHIIEARQRKDAMTDGDVDRLMSDIVRAIAVGTEFDRKEMAGTVRAGVEINGTVVWLTRRQGSNAWVVTAYEKNPDGASAGRATLAPTSTTASLTRDGRVAGFESIVGLPGLDIKRSANGHVQGFFDPQTGKAFMVADSLTAETAPGVLMHEVGIHMAADNTLTPLFNRAQMLLKAQKANPFMRSVQARMDAAGETSAEEAAAYLTEAYENERAAAPASVRKWAADLLAAVKAWLHRKGILGAERLTAGDIAAVARANAKSLAQGKTGPGGLKFSRAQALDKNIPAFGDIRKPRESVSDVANGLSNAAKVLGNRTVPMDSVVGAMSAAADDMARAKELASKLMQPDAFFERVILDDAGNVIEGQHRVTALRILGAKAVPAVVIKDYMRDFDGIAVGDAIRNAQKMASDHSNQLVGMLAEIYADENGDMAEVAQYEAPRGYEKAWQAGIDELSKGGTGLDVKRSATANPDIRFSRNNPPPPTTWTATPLEDKKHRFAWDNIVHALQDKQIDTKRVVQAINDSGGQIQDDLDVSLQEELYHARVSLKSKEFLRDELMPMLDKLTQGGIKLPDFESYMHARHAPEANRVMVERNPTEEELQARMDAIDAQIGAMRAIIGAATPKEQARLQRLIDQGERKKALLASVQPWQGSEEDRQKLSGMSNQEATAVMASLSPQQLQDMTEAARAFDAIVQKNRQEMVDYELEAQETTDGWANMFAFYVPLMREDDGNAQGTGQGFSIKGREVQSRTGSATRKVVDIVANLAMQRERTIVRGEKNRVAQALVGLANANPNADFWKVGAPDRERKYDPRTGTVKLVTNPNFKNLPEVMTAKVRQADGSVKEVAVIFNKDDNRAARMAASLKNLDMQALEGVAAAMAPVTRFLASMSTQYNPIFGVVNLVRDLQGAMVNLAGTPLAGQKGKIAWLAKNAVADIYRAARADRSGQPHQGEWGQWWDMFQEDGGPTGYRDIFQDSQERTKAIDKAMNPDAWMESAFGKAATANGLLKDPMSAAAKGGGWVFDWLSDYNLAMENGVRVSTYRAAVESGMSRQRAASLAKNITVNFNRKGQMGMKVGALYAFFNAAVQGTARMGQALVTMDPGKPKTMRLSPLGKKVVYGGMVLGTLQALALAAAGFDDENPPDFVRERNTIIPIGGGKFITIPMPLGLHVFPGIGRHATEFALSGGKDPAKRAIKVMGMVASSFYPLGSAGMSMQTLSPTALDPLAALLENRDYAGRPIARESMDKNAPGHELTRTTATWLSQGISEAINRVTGGDKYVAGVLSPTPDQIDYLIGQATGGVGREALKLTQTGQAAYTGEELPMHKIPLVGRFVGTANGSSSQASSFYANLTQAKRIDRRIDGLTEDGQKRQAAVLERDNAFLLTKARIADKQVTRLRREKRKLLEDGAPRERVQEVERKTADAMRRFNDATASAAAK